jgi:hypothetical protein
MNLWLKKRFKKEGRACALQEIWFQKLLKRFDDEVRMGRFLCVQALYSISLFGFTLAKS